MADQLWLMTRIREEEAGCRRIYWSPLVTAVADVVVRMQCGVPFDTVNDKRENDRTLSSQLMR